MCVAGENRREETEEEETTMEGQIGKNARKGGIMGEERYGGEEKEEEGRIKK